MADLPATAVRRAGPRCSAGPRPGPLAGQAADITAVDDDLTGLLTGTDGQILTTLPGVATSRAAAFAAFSLPIARFPSAEHLYSATGLAPASYQSATLNRRGRISRQGLPEHRDALMNLAWGLSHTAASSSSATTNCAPEACARSRPGSPSPATPAGWPTRC
ncbi:transposase [Blastococcus sp. SYSU DS0510]